MRVYIINVAILVGCSRHDGSIVIEHALVYRNLPNGVFGSYAHMVVLLSRNDNVVARHRNIAAKRNSVELFQIAR